MGGGPIGDIEAHHRFAESPRDRWVSHLLQRIAHAVMRDAGPRELITRAGAHHAERNAAFAVRLTDLGLPVEPGDGISLMVQMLAPARDVADRLIRRGWLARAGDEFLLLEGAGPSRHLRLTVRGFGARTPPSWPPILPQRSRRSGARMQPDHPAREHPFVHPTLDRG